MDRTHRGLDRLLRRVPRASRERSRPHPTSPDANVIDTAVATPAEQRGRVAVVTGAASAMGLAVAERFIAEGWSVVAIDRAAEAVATVAAVSDPSELRPLDVDISDRTPLPAPCPTSPGSASW